MTDDVPPTGIVVEGHPIPDAIVASLVQRMREAPFRANQIEGVAAHALRQAGLDIAPAMRLADRLIQRYRRANRLTMHREGRSPIFTWRT